MIFAKIGRRVHDRRHASLDWLTRGADRLVVRQLRHSARVRCPAVEHLCAMAAQRARKSAPNLAERLMSAGQRRGRRAGVKNVWRSCDAYPRHNLRLRLTLNPICRH